MESDDLFGPCTFFLLDKLNKLRFEDYIHSKFKLDLNQILLNSFVTSDDQFNKKLFALSSELDAKIIKIKKEIRITEILIEKDMGDLETEVYLDKLYDLPIEYPSLKKKKKKSYRKMCLDSLNILKNKLINQINKTVIDGNVEEYILLMIDLHYINQYISKIVEKKSLNSTQE